MAYGMIEPFNRSVVLNFSIFSIIYSKFYSIRYKIRNFRALSKPIFKKNTTEFRSNATESHLTQIIQSK